MTNSQIIEDAGNTQDAFCEKHGITLVDGTEKSADNWQDVVFALRTHQSVVVTFLGNNRGNPWFSLSLEKLTKEVAEELFDLISADIDENV